MREGDFLGWEYNRTMPPAQSIRDAADRHREKYGVEANVCLLRPDHFTKVSDMMGLPDDGAPLVLGGVTVRPRAGVQRGTMWVGREAGL
jgi:hypothetical protein